MKKFDTIKKFVSFILLAGICSTGFAQWQNGPQRQNDARSVYDMKRGNALVVDTRGHNDFTVVIDNGYSYNSNGGALAINSLNNGDHRITIYERVRSFWGRQRQQVIYNSTVCLRAGMETTIFITGNGQVVKSEKPIYHRDRYDRRNDDNRYGNKRYDDKKDDRYADWKK